MNIKVRPLTLAEQQDFISIRGSRTPIPQWGKVYDERMGKILVFDGADGVRRYTLLESGDVDQLENEINRAAYSSPDAGLLAFLNDLSRRGVGFGVSAMNVAVIAGVIWLLTRAK